MRILLLLSLGVLLSSCGSPTNPSDPPAARLSDGAALTGSCAGTTCTVSGQVLNLGPDCATNVSIVVYVTAIGPGAGNPRLYTAETHGPARMTPGQRANFTVTGPLNAGQLILEGAKTAYGYDVVACN